MSDKPSQTSASTTPAEKSETSASETARASASPSAASSSSAASKGAASVASSAATGAASKAKAALDTAAGWALLAPGEINNTVGKMNRRTMAWIAVGLGAIILLSVNIVSSNFFRSATADLTESGLYSISKSTRRVLGNISEPIDVRIYFSNQLGEQAPLYKRYFERVRALFDQYANLSGNQLKVSYIEPEPFSDAEDRAVAAGLRGVQLNAQGDQGFFGLVATNSTDQEEVVQFFAPERERYLEYDMTKLVHKLAAPKKMVVGIMSGIPIMGGPPQPPMGMPGRPPQQLPKWFVVSQIEEFFDVETIAEDAKKVPDNVDVLMLVQPSGLTAEAAFAVDQFALRGGRVLAFVDPVPDVGRAFNPAAAASGGMNPELEKLLKSWGVEIDPTKIAGDLRIARRVQTGGNQPVVTEYISWLSVKDSLIDQDDVIADSVNTVNLASSGYIQGVDQATTTIKPLLKTTPAAMEVDSSKVMGYQPDPVALLREYKPGSKELVLAARVQGDIKTAFPDGRPTTKAQDKGEAKSGGGETDKKPDAKEATAKTSAPLTSGKLNAIVVADSDLLYDDFWVQMRDMLGQQIALPIAHNATFVVNAIENLSGGEALSGLRGRGVDDRPFVLVDDIRRTAEQRFRQKEQALVSKLNGLQDQLSKVERQSTDGNVILSDADKDAIEKFRGEMVATRKELRDVKHAMRADIDQLEGTLKFVNIAGVPLLFVVGGIAFAAMRRRRTSKSS
ncbi:MAG: GldG family protein [Hyphomicrobiaceae bacterium]